MYLNVHSKGLINRKIFPDNESSRFRIESCVNEILMYYTMTCLTDQT